MLWQTLKKKKVGKPDSLREKVAGNRKKNGPKPGGGGKYGKNHILPEGKVAGRHSSTGVCVFFVVFPFFFGLVFSFFVLLFFPACLI